MTFFTTVQVPSGGTVTSFTLPSGFWGARRPWPEGGAGTADAKCRDIFSSRQCLPTVEVRTQ